MSPKILRLEICRAHVARRNMEKITMADPKVTGLRSAEFRVPDLAAAKKFYEDCWGLETAAEEGGTVYLRGTGSEHHVLALREGGDKKLLRLLAR